MWILLVGLALLFLATIGLVALIRLKRFIRVFRIDSLQNRGWYLSLQVIMAYFGFVSSTVQFILARWQQTQINEYCSLDSPTEQETE